MKIIIVGAGVIGSNLAKELTEENHLVFLLEEDEDTARKIHEKLDVKVIPGSGTDPEILKSAEVSSADMIIAVTASDETNLTVCALASALGAKMRIARVRNSALSQELAQLGLRYFYIDEMINPEEVAAHSIVKIVEAPGAREVADFAEGKILLRSFDILERSPLCDMKIEAVTADDFPWPFLIVFILRDGEVMIPKGQHTIKAGDRIYVLLPTGSLGEFLTFVNPDSRKSKKVVIFGATDIGVRVAQGLTPNIPDLLVLEENSALAERAAGLLQGARIINGAAVETDILIEAGIEAADAFIAVSNNENSNLVSAVLAKKMGAKYTVIINQQQDYMAIIDALKIDAIINPRLLAVHQILRFVRGKGVQSVTKLLDCNAEVLELVPEAGSPVTAGPLKNISFPKDCLVGAVTVGDDVFLAKGETHIRAGERVIVFCHKNAVKKTQRLFNV